MQGERKELRKNLENDKSSGSKMMVDILLLLEKEQSEKRIITIEQLVLPLNEKQETVEKIIKHMEGMKLIEKQQNRIKITKFGSDLLKINNN